MTMFVYVDYDTPSPAEQEVADASAESDGNAEPDVVSHEDEHEEIADDDLEDVQKALDKVRHTAHLRPTEKHNIQYMYSMCVNRLL